MEEKDRPLHGELQLPFKHSYLHGHIYPPFIKQKHLDATKAFKLREDDVVIATFPKNGTTWTQKIVQNLHRVHQTGHDLTKDDKVLADLIPWIENEHTDKPDSMPGPRYLKTHNSYDWVAHDPAVPCKYIYVVRNPKDVCVSLWHHCKGFSVFEYDGPFEEFSELFLQGKVESGDWWDHVKEFYQNKRDMNILFLKYEDMHADGITAIRKINDYCDLPPLSDEMATQVLNLSAFKSMKVDPKSNYSWLDEVRKKDQAPFMRKGKVGDWSNFFTPEMAERFDEKTNRIFADLDLDFSDKM